MMEEEEQQQYIQGQTKRYTEKMGTDLGQLCYELIEEVEATEDRWTIYEHLFTKGHERIELLDSVAPHFFVIVANLLYESVMMALSRMTDPPMWNTRKDRRNLSLKALPERIVDLVFKQRIETEIEEVETKCGFARAWRDRRLAHSDLATIRKLDDTRGPLPSVNGEHINAALKAVSGVLFSLEKHYGVMPSVTITDPWSAEALVKYLEKCRDEH